MQSPEFGSFNYIIKEIAMIMLEYMENGIAFEIRYCSWCSCFMAITSLHSQGINAVKVTDLTKSVTCCGC